MKQVIVVRKDLEMPPGKLGAQTAHASVGVLTTMMRNKNLKKDEVFKSWISNGAAKICCAVSSEEDIIALMKKAAKFGVPAYMVRDAARTVFNEPTITCCAIGPAPEKLVNKITGSLPLYR